MKEIGISLSTREFSSEEIVKYSRAAQKLGLESVWLPSVPEFRDSLEVANQLMMKVHDYSIALSLVSIHSRSPLSLAMSVATLIEKSSNSLILGIGIGDRKWRITLGSQNKRPLLFMSEYVALLHKLLSGGCFSFNGTFFKLDSSQLKIPVDNLPRIYIGATGFKMVELATKKADGLILNGVLSSQYYEKIKKLVPGNRGKSSKFRVIWPFALSMEASEKAARLKMKPYLLKLLSSGKVSVIVENSPHAETMARINSLAMKGKQSQALEEMTNEIMDYFSISGTPELCARNISKLTEWGDFLPVLYPVEVDPLYLMQSITKWLRTKR